MEYFPYLMRQEQQRCLEFIRKNLKRNICLQAPTGFGKTIVILSTLLERGYPIIWAVRTGNETDRPIEELKIINKKKGTQFFGLSYRGKKDMCLLARNLKLKGWGYNDVALLCKSQKKCKYDRNGINVVEIIKKPLLYSEILEIGKELEICPYKLQRLLLPFADVVSLSYNYIVNDGLGWSIRKSIPFEESYLVVDEAHNLQHVCMGLNSDKISLNSIENSLKEMEKFENEGMLNFLLLLKEEMLEEYEAMNEREKEFDAADFLKRIENKSKLDLIDAFNSAKFYGNLVRREQLEKNKKPHSSLHHLANFWLNVIESVGIEGIAFIKRKGKKNLYIEMIDMRASEILKNKWKNFRKCIFCSGTLTPIKAFAETIGLENYSGGCFSFSFDNVVALITEGISTEGERMSKEMMLKYIEAIKQFIEAMNANIAIFSASYRIQNNLIKAGLRKIVENAGRKFFKESQGMQGDKARKILDEFKECAANEQKGVLVATASGRFAEGADFPGEELEGIFLVGIPFDKMNVKTKLYLKYYEKLYGKRKGSYYAYIVPAMRRASQSLGRALRAKEEKAILICGDKRYKERRFLNLLPDYFQRKAEVVDYVKIYEKIKRFNQF